MKLEKIAIATGNEHKVEEIRSLLSPFRLMIMSLPAGGKMPAETGGEFRENARIKAQYGFELTGLPTLADDSGLEVDALKGAPGVHSARYAGEGAGDAANNQKLLLALEGVQNRRARFRCSMVLVMEDMTIEADGTCEGIILDGPRGRGGFGYDPLFWLPDLGKTMAEISPREKNKISHRGRALVNLVLALKARGLL
ncbi:MAG TPA: non-canonical purine NTP pyrophosphatase, RdgB/HAM1 family [Firmicutes bacterium]|mgnify:CR=1 FL=1|jgi:XTP/dITP diphosphohydrolase|nr:non-canonical purine NTP pyrophosphatase, RdgB/HAM1 family [Bacillota bacterium]